MRIELFFVKRHLRAFLILPAKKSYNILKSINKTGCTFAPIYGSLMLARIPDIGIAIVHVKKHLGFSGLRKTISRRLEQVFDQRTGQEAALI